jgi:arabinofuranosyltransferase
MVEPWAKTALAATGLVALALAGVAVFLHAQLALTGNLWGVPLDDAYIHFRFIHNLATGHGFAFNPDQPVPGSTSPLWVLLLALPTACGAPVWISAKVCGVLFLIASAVLAWRLATRYIAVPIAAWTVGALTALDGRLLWAAPSGMEVTLFTTLSLAAFLARPAPNGNGDRTALKRRVLLVAALCGLSTLARPEGYLLTVVLFGDLLARLRPPIAAVLSAFALYVALVAPYNVFALLTTGHPLPTTFYAKSVPLGPLTLPHALVYVAALAYLLVAGNVILILAPLGAFALWRSAEATNAAVATQTVGLRRQPLRSPRPFKVRPLPWSFKGRPAVDGRGECALVAWPLMLIAEQAVLSPVLYHFGRYVMPLQPFLLLWTVAGLARLTRVYAPASKHGWSMTLVSSVLVVASALSLGGWAQRYAGSVRDIDGMQVALGRWVRTHIPVGAPVAAHDIGAIGYISNHPIVDIEGLVTPRFLALKREQPEGRRAAAIDAAFKRLGARYLIAFPRAYQSLTTQPGMRRVYSVTVRDPLIVQEATMGVYEVVSSQ